MGVMQHPALEEGDSAAILDLVESLTAVETLDDYSRMAMIGMRELIPCIDSSYNEMNPNAGRIKWTAEPANSRMGEFAPLFARLMRQNPLVKHFEDTADTRAMMWSDLMSPEEVQHTELWQEMFRPLGVYSQMAMVVPTPPGIVVGFAVNTDEKGFSERERAIFNALRPHLAHFYRSIRLLEETREEPGWTGALANEDGVIEAVTQNAADLKEQTGIGLNEGRTGAQSHETVIPERCQRLRPIATGRPIWVDSIVRGGRRCRRMARTGPDRTACRGGADPRRRQCPSDGRGGSVATRDRSRFTTGRRWDQCHHRQAHRNRRRNTPQALGAHLPGARRHRPCLRNRTNPGLVIRGSAYCRNCAWAGRLEA